VASICTAFSVDPPIASDQQGRGDGGASRISPHILKQVDRCNLRKFLSATQEGLSSYRNVINSSSSSSSVFGMCCFKSQLQVYIEKYLFEPIFWLVQADLCYKVWFLLNILSSSTSVGFQRIGEQVFKHLLVHFQYV
jgi:hypothetical protein